MKRGKKILVAVLAIAVVAVGGVAWQQRENLKAVQEAVKYSSGEIENKLQENQQAIKDAVSNAPEVSVRDVTEEEREALRDGSLSQEELAQKLVEDAAQQTEKPETQEPVSQARNPASQPQDQPAAEELPEEKKEDTAAQAEYQKQLSTIIAEVYVMQEHYTITLDNMYAEAKEAYKDLPESKRTKTQLVKMAGEYISRARDLEKECDQKMDDVVARLETLIRENNGDLSLVDTVVYTYASEKSLKKAWYMSELQKRGLV